MNTEFVGIQSAMTSFVPASSSVSEKEIYRIEVSLASRKTTVRVLPTYARVFVLEERYEVPQPGHYGSEQPLPVMHRHEWKLVCTGIPCVLTERQEPHPSSPYAVKAAIAEAESGLAIWDCAIEPSSEYRASQANFHTFKSATRIMHGVQFLDMMQAQIMFDLLTELLTSEFHLSRYTSVLWCMEEDAAERDKGERKKPEGKRRSMSVSKKDISKPCNFIHLAGITNKRTETCEKELTGTMRRMKERSMSLSNLTDEEPQKSTPRMSKRFSLRRSKRKSSKPSSPTVSSPFTAQTSDSYATPTYATPTYNFRTFNKSRSASEMPKSKERPYSTYSLGFEPSTEPDIDTMFRKRSDQRSVPVRATIPEYVLQTNGSAHQTASIGGSSSKTASPTDELAPTSKGTTAPERQTFSTAAYSRGYNPLPSKFAPMYSSAASLTSEGKSKRRLDSSRARVSISDSLSNISDTTSFVGDEDGEDDSPFFVERYAQQGPETSVEASLTPMLDPDEYCNEVGRRGLRSTGVYSYGTYTRNVAKQKDLAPGVLRRPAVSGSVSSGPSIPRSASGQYRVGGAVQPARPASPSNSSHSSSSKMADSQHSDIIDPRRSLADTAQLVSQYTERMSEALQMFDNLVLSELDYNGRAPTANTRLPPAEIAYGTLSSEV